MCERNSNILQDVDELLIDQLNKYSSDEQYWSFKGRASRRHSHIYYQYPAMMVPDMQGELLDIITKIQPSVTNVLDPFVGSGTTMTECMSRGLEFTGQDINPFAVLLCNAKVGPFNEVALGKKVREICERAQEDNSDEIMVDFPGLIKWFRGDVAIELSRLHTAIRKERFQWARRFFWIVLAETVRLTSNSRTSTYKLHIRPKEEIYERTLLPISLFQNIAERNIKELLMQKNMLKGTDFIHNNKYYKNINISLKDSSKEISTPSNSHLYDLVVTSPPYGDNQTTVPYGQHSFLPLQWIDLEDIGTDIDKSWISSTLEIDKRSLGGLKQNSVDESILEYSPTLAIIINQLSDAKRHKVLAFFNDIDKCICKISSSLNKNAYLIWTVGNRRVNGIEIPTDLVLSEIMIRYNIKSVTSLSREIYSKRMPKRNNSVATMKNERVLILRKL